MALIPIGDNIIVKMVEAETITSGGVVLPSSSKEKSQIAEVVASNIDEVVVGEKVVISKFTGTNVKYEDIEYCIVKKSDIIAKIEENL